MEENYQTMNLVEVTEQAALSELSSEVVDAMTKEREAMYRICSFHNVDFQELVDENELTHGSICWTVCNWCSVSQHMLFQSVAGTKMLITML